MNTTSMSRSRLRIGSYSGVHRVKAFLRERSRFARLSDAFSRSTIKTVSQPKLLEIIAYSGIAVAYMILFLIITL